jgi:membrane fusion protein
VTPLFRQQALDHQRERFHGVIVLRRHWWFTVLTALLMVLLGSLIAFAAFAGFTRKESVRGALVPRDGLLRVAAAQAGIVTSSHVADGQAVQAGDLLFVISAERASALGSTQAVVAQTLDARQAHLRSELQQRAAQTENQRTALDQRITSLGQSLQQQDRELRLQRERTELIRDVAQRYPELVRSGAVSEVEAKEKATELIDQQARLAALEQARLGLQREMASLQAQRKDQPIEAEQHSLQLQREAQALAQQSAVNEADRETRVRAPRAGRLVALVAAPGQAVEAGQPLATLLPVESPIEAELYAPARAIGFVQPGTAVRLRYEAFPYEKFGQFSGRVREVSRSAIPIGELPLAQTTAARAGEWVYRIRVELPGQTVSTPSGKQALQPGMPVQASLVAEQRTLFEWMFEPLLGMAAQP